MEPAQLYRLLLEDFCRALGFNSFKDEPFSVTVDGKLDINIGFEKSCEAIVFVSYIASLSDRPDSHSLLRILLEANYANQISPYGSLGLSPESDDIVFSFKVPLHELDLSSLLQIFEHIIAVSRLWYDDLHHPQTGLLSDTFPKTMMSRASLLKQEVLNK